MTKMAARTPVILLLAACAPLAAALANEPPAPPKAGEERVEPKTGMSFAWVPKGCFQMGAEPIPGMFPIQKATEGPRDDESPRHEACVDGFWMGRSEVTQGQWSAVMGENPSYHATGPNHPVEMVSWQDAHAYADKLAALSSGRFRLPSEAEWEYACTSGGKEEVFSGSAEHKDISEYVWTRSNVPAWENQPVATKKPNGLGLHDMSGNLAEWVEDGYDPEGYRKHDLYNPKAPHADKRRGLRGGSYRSNVPQVRCAMRNWDYLDDRLPTIGFRLVWEPQAHVPTPGMKTP